MGRWSVGKRSPEETCRVVDGRPEVELFRRADELIVFRVSNYNAPT
jgi:hypothetical protein